MRNEREQGVMETIVREPDTARDGAVDERRAEQRRSRRPGDNDMVRAPAGWWGLLSRFAPPLLVATVLLLAALWPRAPFALDVGAPGDRLLLRDVHGDERLAEYSYRWTGYQGRPATLVVPGWAAVRRARVEVRAQALPGQPPVALDLLAGDVVIGTVPVDGQMLARTVEVARPAGQTAFALTLRAPLTTAPGDERQLGVKLDTIRLTPLAYDMGLYWRTVWLKLAPLLGLVALGLALVDRLRGRVGWAVRVSLALLVPLATALALPWTLALLPYALAALAALLAWCQRLRLLDRLVTVWTALDRPVVAGRVALAGSALYAVTLLWHVWQTPWIGHADYADNAVVAANLVRGRGFSVDYVAQFYRDYPTPHHPADTWPPLQPLLIAPFFALLGVSTQAAKLPNLLIMTALLLLTYRAGAALWSPRVGLLAALFLALQDYLFDGVVYPLNDIAFTFLAFVCLLLLGKLTITEPAEQLVSATAPAGQAPMSPPHVWVWWALLGLCGGLLFLAKPSGVLLLAGAASWALWQAWRQGRPRLLLVQGAVATGVAALTVAPWLARNLLTFGRLFYTTEQYDAWILKYRQWEEIYRVYAGRTALPHPRLLVGYGFDRVTEAIAYQFRALWSDLIGGTIVPVWLLPPIVLGACVAARRGQARLAIVVAATVPYLLFILTYWHYEERYLLFLWPWAALLAAGGLCWLYTHLAAARGQRLAVALLTAALVFLLAPQVALLRDNMAADRRVPSYVKVATWLRDNTPANAVVMTRNPWDISFHSGREAVMIPYDDWETIRAIGQRYRVSYLQLDSLDKTRLQRPALAPLYRGEEALGFRKVYELRGSDGNLVVVVYQFPGAER